MFKINTGTLRTGKATKTTPTYLATGATNHEPKPKRRKFENIPETTRSNKSQDETSRKTLNLNDVSDDEEIAGIRKPCKGSHQNHERVVVSD
jgi:hypothetical protein